MILQIGVSKVLNLTEIESRMVWNRGLGKAGNRVAKDTASNVRNNSGKIFYNASIFDAIYPLT